MDPTPPGKGKTRRFAPKPPPPPKNPTAKDKQVPGPDGDKEKSSEEVPSTTEKTEYPIVLPLRRPKPGDTDPWTRPKTAGDTHPSEVEDEDEDKPYNEDDINSAQELGLLAEDQKDRDRQMYWFQFPTQLPSVRALPDTHDISKGEEEMAGTSGSGGASKRTTSLEDLPEGRIGKMLVYKSGAVKLKMGDVLFDVEPAILGNMPQNVMAVNTTTRDCVDLGEVIKKANVTPNLDFLDRVDK